MERLALDDCKDRLGGVSHIKKVKTLIGTLEHNGRTL
jgi:hypothetical protein